MAVFMLNICKFDDCGITFPSLADLILHIEDTHIDYDPAVIEQKEQQQPPSLPLSYVLKFYSNSARRESQLVDIKRRLIQHANKSAALVQSYNSNSPDEEEAVTESEDSNESWTTSEEFSSEYILKYGSRISSQTSSITSTDKPFVCPVPGCKKRYKNINGIKYHSKNGHKKNGKVKKGYKCHCGKNYKTSQGLKNHANIQHVYSHTTVANAINYASEHKQNIVEPLPRTGAVKQTPVKPVKTDPKTLEALKLKSMAECNRKLLAAKKITPELPPLLENDVNLLTPATSPESLTQLSNKQNICDIRTSNN
ncbi:uncharacterized protein CBL_05256 [Carabus blaptoides fortunei]